MTQLFVYSLDLDVNSRRNRVITLIRIVRLLRVMRVLKQFSSVASALGLMLPVLLRFVGVMLLYFYVFAVIGCALVVPRRSSPLRTSPVVTYTPPRAIARRAAWSLSRVS